MPIRLLSYNETDDLFTYNSKETNFYYETQTIDEHFKR